MQIYEYSKKKTKKKYVESSKSKVFRLVFYGNLSAWVQYGKISSNESNLLKTSATILLDESEQFAILNRRTDVSFLRLPVR